MPLFLLKSLKGELCKQYMPFKTGGVACCLFLEFSLLLYTNNLLTNNLLRGKCSCRSNRLSVPLYYSVSSSCGPLQCGKAPYQRG